MTDTHFDGTPAVTGDYEDDLLIDVGYTQDDTGVWQPPSPKPKQDTVDTVLIRLTRVTAACGLGMSLANFILGAGLVHIRLMILCALLIALSAWWERDTPGRVDNPPPKPQRIAPPPSIPSESARPKADRVGRMRASIKVEVNPDCARCERFDISAIEDPPGTHFIDIPCARHQPPRRQTG